MFGSKKEQQKRLLELESRNKQLSDAHEKLSTDHAELQTKHATLQGDHNRLTADHEEVKDKHEDEIDALHEQIDKLKGSSIDILDKSMLEVKALKEELESEKAKNAELVANITANVAEGKVEGKTDASSPASSIPETDEVAALKKELEAVQKEAAEDRRRALELTQEWDEKVKEIEEMNNTQTLSAKLRVAEKSAFKSSQELVVQAEKNFKLHDELTKFKDAAKLAKEETADVRKMLIREIAGSGARAEAYEHIPIPELVRLLGQALIKGSNMGGTIPVASMAEGATMAKSSPNSKQTEDEDKLAKTLAGAESWTLDSIRTVETEMKNMRSTIKKLQNEVSLQKSINEQGLAAMDTVQQLKERLEEMSRRNTRQKEKTEESREEVRRGKDRVKALSEHIEKLMVHLKHEAASKARSSAETRRVTKELKLAMERNEALISKNRSRERVIRELREGCRILEDQLRLMDEKYIELRNKLDWTRNQSQKEVRKIQDEANKLRVKWMMVAGADATLQSLGMDSPQQAKPERGINKSASLPALKKGKQRPHTMGGGTELPPLIDGPGAIMNQLFANGVPEDGVPEATEDPSDPWSDNKLNELHNFATGADTN